jgi:hypothetical protein
LKQEHSICEQIEQRNHGEYFTILLRFADVQRVSDCRNKKLWLVSTHSESKQHKIVTMFIVHAFVSIVEKKAKEADNMKRLIAKRAREDNARAWRKLKTESQIIGVLMSSNEDFSIDNHKRPVPGGMLVLIQLYIF